MSYKIKSEGLHTTPEGIPHNIPKGSPCLTPNHLIATEHGFVSAESLTIRDKILTITPGSKVTVSEIKKWIIRQALIKERVEEVVAMLKVSEAKMLKYRGCNGAAFFDEDGNLTRTYTPICKERKKYFAIDIGGSGVWLVEKETGEIFNVKGYGVADKNKKAKADLGNICDYTTQEQVDFLHTKKYNYLNRR